MLTDSNCQHEEEIDIEINNQIYRGKRIISKLNCGKYHQVIMYETYANIDGDSYYVLQDPSMREKAKLKLQEILEDNIILGNIESVVRSTNDH